MSIEFFNDESILTQEAINVTTTKCDTVGISLVVNNTEIVLELAQLRLAVSHLEGMIDE